MNFMSSLAAAVLLSLFCAFASAAETGDIVFRTPSGFSELSDKTSPLFRETAEEGVSQGELLRIYLPEYIAHQYKYGSADAVTRQVIICGLKNQTRPLNEKDIEILSRMTETMFNNFSVLTKKRTDTPAQETERRRKTIESSMETGTPLLLENLRLPSSYLYIWLNHYAMSLGDYKSWLSTAMATAIVPVKDTALFISASAIIDRSSNPEADLEWVKDTAATFASMIEKNNK